MIRVLLLLASILSTLHLSAQLSRSLKGNEWIDYSKEYHKIQVGEDGIYAISNEELQAMGIDPSTDKSHVHVYNLGKEVRIIENADGLIFYGLKNRGQVDALGYEKDEDVLNPEYSMITDTAAYFLMVDDTKEALRYKSLEQDLQENTIEASPYYLHEEKMVFSSFGNKPNGAPSDFDVYYSSLMPGEGFSSTRNITFKHSLEVKNIYPDGPDTKVKLFWATNNTDNHLIEINVNEKLHRVDSSKYEEMLIDEIFVPSSEIDGKLPIEMKGKYSNNDRFSVALIETTFPRTFTYPQKNIWNLEVPQKSEPQYIEIDGANTSLSVLNHTTGERFLSTTSPSGKQGFLLPASDKNIHLTIYSSTTSSVYAGKRTYTDYSNKPNDYIIISHPSLIESLASGTPMEQYVAYRKSEIGGGFDPIVIDINQLYDQYGYGVNRHFLAIRNFGKELRSTWSKPSYIFLIGKGLNYNLGREETPEQIATNLVPTFGYPTSDNLLIANEKGNFQNYAIGRLAATETATITDYLDKVMTYENYTNLPQNIEDKKWLKNVFHLAGGEVQFDNYLKRLADIIEANKYGANVQSYGKAGSGNVDDSFFEKSYELINNGVSIISFMGHASVVSLEANLDRPDNYQNYKKYPLFFVLGCVSGDVCSGSYGISESFVNIKDKGAVAFVATTGQSYPYHQYYFTNFVYKAIGENQYGSRLGDIIQSSLDSIVPPGKNLERESFMHQLLLNGDPALKVLSFEGPDYVIDKSTLITNPSVVTIADPSFETCFDIVNIGSHKNNQNLTYRIKHLSPDGSVAYDSLHTVNILASTQKVCISLPLEDQDLVGKNRLLIELNPDKTINEMPNPEAISNNQLIDDRGELGFAFDVLGNGVLASYPYNYAIVDTTNIDLVATTYNAFAKEADYIFELDTLPDFSSDFKKATTVKNKRTPFSWNVNLLDNPDQVYYWRVSHDTLKQGSKITPLWDEHSFTYIQQAEHGWGQGHWGQFEQNDKNIIKNDKNNWSYEKGSARFSCISESNSLVQILRDGAYWDVWDKKLSSGLAIGVIDTTDAQMWVLEKGETPYDNYPPRQRTVFFEYKASTDAEMESLMEFLENTIPDGYAVIVFPIKKQNANFPLEYWRSQASAKKGFPEHFKRMGAENIDEFLNTGHPYIFAYVKGRGKHNEGIFKDRVAIKFDATKKEHIGTLRSPEIKSKKLKSLETVFNGSSGDIVKVRLLKEDQDGSFYTYKTYTSSGIYPLDDNMALNEKVKIEIEVRDSIDYIPDLPKVRLYYDGVPDLALSIKKNLEMEYDEGTTIRIPLEVHNISEFHSESLIGLNLTLSNKSKSSTKSYSFDGLRGKTSIDFPVELSTIGFDSDTKIQVELNKEKIVYENKYLNNLGISETTISSDKISPNLNVKFDGQQINDYDIVSPNPKIEISLQDENKFKLLDSLNLFDIELRDENNIAVNYSDNLTFTPASSAGNNIAIISLSPTLEDGLYRLIVKAKDNSDNSTNGSYEITFRVINDNMISQVYNYPNPFSTSTQFIFTLTGSTLPSSMIIRIYTASGKVVREISGDELGPFRIGINKTEYRWKGTDEYGNKLANGVYFYKVTTRDKDDNSYEKFVTGKNSNQYFNNGFGKLVILR